MSALFNNEKRCTGSLFERIAQKEPSELVVNENDNMMDFVYSIKRSLNTLLNTRPGGSQCTMSLGLIDFNDVMTESTDLIHDLKSAIKTCIKQFEPRIDDVEVEARQHPQQPLIINFRVIGQLTLQNNAQVLAFNIQVSHHKRYVLY